HDHILHDQLTDGGKFDSAARGGRVLDWGRLLREDQAEGEEDYGGDAGEVCVLTRRSGGAEAARSGQRARREFGGRRVSRIRGCISHVVRTSLSEWLAWFAWSWRPWAGRIGRCPLSYSSPDTQRG